MSGRPAPDDAFEPRGRPPFAAHSAAYIPCGFPLSEEVHPWCAATGLCNGLRAYHGPVSSGGAIRVSLRWNDEPDLHASVDLLFDSPTIFVYGLMEASAVRNGRFIGGMSALLRSWFGVDVNAYTLVQPTAAAPVGKSRQRRCPPPLPPPPPPPVATARCSPRRQRQPDPDTTVQDRSQHRPRPGDPLDHVVATAVPPEPSQSPRPPSADADA